MMRMSGSIYRLAIGVGMTLQGFAALGQTQVQVQPRSGSDAPVLVAAGSLSRAMDEIMLAYRAQGGAQFIVQYGPSGRLRQEIEAGKKVDVFASASTDHTEALAQQRLLGASQVFTHNDLCVVARPALDLTEYNLLQVLSRPSVRLATSTPVSDPMGDYTWQFFRKADARQPGLYRMFDAKALKLSGAAPLSPGTKLPYISAFEENKADAYVMYCTNAVLTKNALPQLTVVRIPNELNVRSAYGIAAHPASAEGERFIRFVRDPVGRKILKKHGFQ
jgi:molybdenum ABC transporter molybdate-binding protein